MSIAAEPLVIGELLRNLIENAIVYAGRGAEVTVRVTVANEVARLEVEDNGPGIPAAVMGNIMQPFFTTKEEGTGLGLSIAARIVEDHGGHIEVESAEGRGATFSIFLPIRTATLAMTTSQVVPS